MVDKLENTSLDDAIANMRQFVAELLETFGELDWQYVGSGDKPRHNNGWYAFEIGGIYFPRGLYTSEIQLSECRFRNSSKIKQ